MDFLSNLSIHCIQGDENKMSGRLIVYALVKDAEIPKSLQNMVHNGILAVEGDYVSQKNIKDFFRQEFNLSMGQGIEVIIGKLKKDEYTSDEDQFDLHSKKFKDKMKSIKSIEMIPIPAKIIQFDSVEEIKLQKGYDIYDLGEFDLIQHAHLIINAFPIIYQARYREQEQKELQEEINQLLTNLPQVNSTRKKEKPKKSKEYLLQTLIPKILYSAKDPQSLEKTQKELEFFLKDYPFPKDIQKLKDLIAEYENSQNLESIKLIVDKIWYLQNEDYKSLEKIKHLLNKMGL